MWKCENVEMWKCFIWGFVIYSNFEFVKEFRNPGASFPHLHISTFSHFHI